MLTDAENEEGLTPLHCAAIGNSAECVQLLLDAKADRDVADREGCTPCDHAPESAQVSVKGSMHLWKCFRKACKAWALQPWRGQRTAEGDE